MLAAETGFAPAADLPPDVRIAANVDQQKDQISQYVKAELVLVASGTKKGSDPRDDLARQIEPTPTVVPSAQFIHVYLDAVANEMPALANSPDEQKRMLAAIVLYRLASDAPTSPRLMPLVEKVIADPSPAVALWGIKSATAMLPEVLKVPVFGAKQKLTDRIVTAVKSHPAVGPLVQDAYNALSLYDANANKLFVVPQQGYEACTDAMNQVMAVRVQQYAMGVPPYPQAERITSSYFTGLSIANAIPAKQKLETIQQLTNLMAITAAQLGNAGGAKADLTTDISVYAGLLDILLGPANRAASLLKPISLLKANGNNPTIPAMVQAAITAVKTVPGYAVLKDPPTPVTTQPATGA